MNKFIYGDNLDVMRKFIRDEKVDLCYIDPPFARIITSKPRSRYSSLAVQKGALQWLPRS